MRIVFKLVILGVVLLLVVHYVSPQLLENSPVSNWVVSAEKMFNNILSKDKHSELITVSKWTDAKGVVHYENRPVEGAKKIEVDPNTNVLPPAPVVKLPEAKEEKPKTMNEEVQALQKAKDAHTESIINN